MFLHHLANRLIVFNEDKVFVFEGTYQDFLDRVGWEDEPKKQSKEKKADKEKRRQQAQEAEYNKKQKSLHTKIAKIEKHIDDEEKALEAVNLNIAESAGKAGGEEIQKLQIKAHKHQQALDSGYSELEKLIAELDALSAPVV
jgi:ATP-binding cassette subfamily F protein 3